MKNLVAIGKVSTINTEKRTVRVLREDVNLVTAELKVLDRGDGWFPKIGDYVLCLFYPIGTSGVILGEV